MAYLHCHSCDWSQDDFWTWKWKGFLKFWKFSSRPFGYNPLSLFLEDVATYYKPRYIIMDSYWAKENGFNSNRIHSWIFILRSMKNNIKRMIQQEWWTHETWYRKHAKGEAICPKCGADNFDVD